jgi:hypothetical protein
MARDIGQRNAADGALAADREIIDIATFGRLLQGTAGNPTIESRKLYSVTCPVIAAAQFKAVEALHFSGSDSRFRWHHWQTPT